MTITEITLAGVQFSQHSRRLGSDVSASGALSWTRDSSSIPTPL
eukprot:CAMPEP_0182589706 /NCGR_PEP_ID=MMETSP1324-20130603/70113_1 /TAXON_ID=236786 /ORGANISM="Florenciella sp., Strain RCC1587" /LENGTH=43 /DNA_ID= /DNA_START= /DNA_END= /DNA_ORIENTATION=